MRLSRIAALLKADMTSGATNPDVRILLTDSRSLTDASHSLFFALRTRSGDGHHFIAPLYRAGVRAFVVARDWQPRDGWTMPGATFLRVDDTLAALQQVGSSRRSRARRVVAITGSRGKTAVKEWLFQLLSPMARISRSPRSYNSGIGVPLSLWETPTGTDMAIIETGISRHGEMETLRNMIRPDTVIITNVGAPHAEGFASTQQKAADKVSLAALPTTHRVIYCVDDPTVSETVRTLDDGTRLLFGWSRKDKSAPLYIEFGDDGEMTFIYAGTAYRLKGDFPDEAARQNVSHALACALVEGFDPELLSRRLPSLSAIGTRLNVIDGVNGCSIIHDSYTADFSSLRPVLDFMRRRITPGQSPVVIMSDLDHEVTDEEQTYRRIATLLHHNGVDRFIGIGPGLSAHSEQFGDAARFFASTDEFLSSVSPGDFAGDLILLKGAPRFGFGRILERLEARTHETVLEVNLDAVVDNYNYFRSLLPPKTGIVAMVKASGYGAGSYEIAKTLQDCGASYLAVAVLDEGIDLRRQGITMPVMVMNPRVVNYSAMFAYRLEPEIYSFEMLHDVISEAGRCGVSHYPIHIKLDTGMHRMGFVEEELTGLMDLISGQRGVEIRSVFSHLATADCLDMDDYTRLQLERFARATDYMLSRTQRPFLRHILNSAGILRFPEAHYDMARLGIGLYGVDTLPPDIERPLSIVSALRTVIVNLRPLPAGESIGYGRRTILSRDTVVATIPIGYADGMNRRFGQGAVSVLVNGKEAPTLGNICMDACMIDVTDIDCKVGDSVEIFGPKAPIHRLADALGTIPYEILTSVSPRVKRVYFRD